MITDKELGLMISVFSKQAGSSLLTRVALPPGGETVTAAALQTHGEKGGKVVFVTQNLDQDQTKKTTTTTRTTTQESGGPRSR